MIEILGVLVFAHYVADFPLQGDFIANMKGKYDYLLFSHCVIWAGCISLVLAHFNLFSWCKVLFLLFGHFAIDRWKARKQDKTNALTLDLWKDQLLHMGQLLLVAIT